jgi:hypothetical protein
MARSKTYRKNIACLVSLWDHDIETGLSVFSLLAGGRTYPEGSDEGGGRSESLAESGGKVELVPRIKEQGARKADA